MTFRARRSDYFFYNYFPDLEKTNGRNDDILTSTVTTANIENHLYLMGKYISKKTVGTGAEDNLLKLYSQLRSEEMMTYNVFNASYSGIIYSNEDFKNMQTLTSRSERTVELFVRNKNDLVFSQVNRAKAHCDTTAMMLINEVIALSFNTYAVLKYKNGMCAKTCLEMQSNLRNMDPTPNALAGIAFSYLRDSRKDAAKILSLSDLILQFPINDEFEHKNHQLWIPITRRIEAVIATKGGPTPNYNIFY